MAKDSRKLSSDETVRAADATTLETLIRQRTIGNVIATVLGFTVAKDTHAKTNRPSDR